MGMSHHRGITASAVEMITLIRSATRSDVVRHCSEKRCHTGSDRAGVVFGAARLDCSDTWDNEGALPGRERGGRKHQPLPGDVTELRRAATDINVVGEGYCESLEWMTGP